MKSVVTKKRKKMNKIKRVDIYDLLITDAFTKRSYEDAKRYAEGKEFHYFEQYCADIVNRLNQEQLENLHKVLNK